MPFVKRAYGSPLTRGEKLILLVCDLCLIALFILAVLEAQGITLWR